MTNIDRAADIIEYLTDEPHLYPDGGLPDAAAQALDNNGLLAPDPQIIRTREEIDFLDPDTVLSAFRDDGVDTIFRAWDVWQNDDIAHFPAVVITTGDAVRAARQALEEA